MLPKQENKLDIDGYAMLLLSTLLMLATAGLSYAYYFRKVFRTAKNETNHCDENAVVLVLGKKLVDEQPDLEYLQRLICAKNILNKYTSTEVIILGGITGNANISEAHAGLLYLEKNEIDNSRINLEEKSRNTIENIRNSISFLKERKKKIVIVSNRYHLLRAKQMANGFGLNVDLCGAEETLSMNMSSILKIMMEALHVHWYKSGRYYAKITNNIRILDRIGKY